MCDVWLGLLLALLSDDCGGFSELIVLLVWMRVSDSLIAYAWLLPCLPVATCLWPDPTGAAVEEEGDEGCARRRKNHSENVLESSCLSPNSTVSLLVLDKDVTLDEETVGEKLSFKTCIQSGSRFHLLYLQRWCCLGHVIHWAALKSARLFPDLPNLENIGFFSFKSVFLLHSSCHCADYVMPKVTAQGLSQELDKLEHVWITLWV